MTTSDPSSRTQTPVTIITGFLGAGKTTLLNNILHGDHGIKVAVLVNDFGAINIDSQLVVGVENEGEMISLANGCICCTIRSDLLKATLNLLERREGPPEYIIVETSGVSDPLSVAQTFSVPELRSMVQIDAIITVVDAEQLGTLKKEMAYLAFEQLSVADIIVLNKTDLVSRDQLDALRKEWLYPQARVIETSFAQVPLEFVLGVGRYDPARYVERPTRDVHVHEAGAEEDHDHDHGPSDHSMVFSSWSWASDKPLSLKAVRRVTKSLPPSIFRAKGILYLADEPEHKGILHMVGTRLRLVIGEPWGTETPHSQLVAIGSNGQVDGAALTEQFDSCLAENAKNPVERVVGTVMDWLRGKG